MSTQGGRLAWVFFNSRRLRSGWRLLGIVLLLAAAVRLATLLRPGILGAFPGGLAPLATSEAPGFLAGFALLAAALGLPVLAALPLLDRRPFESLGWHRYRGVSRDLLFGAAVGAGCALLVHLVPFGLGPAAGEPAHGLPRSVAGSLLALGLLAVALALRETLLRGCLLAALVEGIGAESAVLVSAILGGGVLLAWHLLALAGLPPWTAILCLFVEGLLLGQAMRRSRSLWISWALSCGWHGMLGVLLGLPILGVRLVAAPALTAKALPDGVDLGPMSSLAGAGGLVLALAAVLLFGPTPDPWTAELWDRHVRGSRPRAGR